MPKAKDKKRRSREDEDIDEEFTQPSQSQRKRKGAMEDDDSDPSSQGGGKGSQKAKPKLSKAELEAKVSETVRFILFSDTSKGAIKKADIVSKVLKDHRCFQDIITGARKVLSQVFGYQLEEVELGAARAKAYLLTNNLEQENDDDFINWENQQPKMGLLLIILSLIFMSGNVLTEEVLWHSLKKMGIEQKKKHRVFADVEKLINQEYVKQLYLERKKISGGEVASFEYRWGIRANRELTKRKVLEFVSQIYGYGTDIELWGSQYRQVLEEEAENEENAASNA